MNLAYIYSQDGSLCVLIGSSSYTVHTGHINYLAIKKAVSDRDVSQFLRLMDVQETIDKASEGKVTVVNGNVLYCGQTINDILTQRMLNMIRDGYDIVNFTKFLNNLMENPSHNSTNQLCTFLENKCLPFTDDGCFLAYKSVRPDYKDKYSGTINNNIGQKPSMPRNMISDNPANTCDVGLHVGALHYAGPNGWYHNNSDHVMIVKVNPKDVVCVPNDYTAGKMRTCEYEVIAEYKGELNKPVYTQDEDLKTAEEIADEVFDDDNELLDSPDYL